MHLHLNLLLTNIDQAESRDLYNRICHEAINGGGSFSAEHGLGKIKKLYLTRMLGTENMHSMTNVKRQFDTNDIMGAGKIFEYY